MNMIIIVSTTHIHEEEVFKTTPWVLFLIFVFGPCEPLIPLVMYPAAKNNFHGAVIVAILFSLTTISYNDVDSSGF